MTGSYPKDKDPLDMTPEEFGEYARWCCWVLTSTTGGWDAEERRAFLEFLRVIGFIREEVDDANLLDAGLE